MDNTYQLTAALGLVNIFRDGYPEPLTVYNSGTLDLLVTDDDTGTSDGFPLSPGTTIVWDAKRPLAAQVVAGEVGTGTLVVLDNSGAVSNPSAIAAALLVGGLAGAIASAIAISGAPPLNAYNVIGQPSVLNAGSLTSPTFAPQDVRKYNSIVATVHMSPLVGSFTTSKPAYRSMAFQWFTDNNGAPGSNITTDTYYLCEAAAGNAYFGTYVRTPCRGAWLVISFGPVQNSTAGNHTTTITSLITGQYASVLQPQMQLTTAIWNTDPSAFGWSFSNGDFTDNFWSVSIAKASGASPITYPPVQNGNVFLNVACNAVGVATMFVTVYDLVDNRQIARLPLVVGSLGGSQAFIAPNRPISLNIEGPTAVCTAVIVSMDWFPL